MDISLSKPKQEIIAEEGGSQPLIGRDKSPSLEAELVTTESTSKDISLLL